MKQILPFLLIILVAACTSKDPFQRFEKFSGLWQAHDSETYLYEEWTEAKKNSMTIYGKSYTLNGNDSIIYERMELRQKGEDVFYTPTLRDQNNSQPVPFKLIFSTDSSYTFENRQHDFPQRIIYRFVTNDSLVGRIEGTNRGEEMSQEFYYHRVK